jgi:16S rRNA (guanine527-N7)-methyltransferase
MDGRVESVHFEQTFQTIVSRAFASLERFVALTSCHLASDGRLVAMKGKLASAELEAVADMSPRARPLQVPGLDVTRHVVLMQSGKRQQ